MLKCIGLKAENVNGNTSFTPAKYFLVIKPSEM